MQTTGERIHRLLAIWNFTHGLNSSQDGNPAAAISILAPVVVRSVPRIVHSAPTWNNWVPLPFRITLDAETTELISRTGLHASALPLLALKRLLAPFYRNLRPRPPEFTFFLTYLILGPTCRITRQVDSLMAEITNLRESIASPSNRRATEFTGPDTSRRKQSSSPPAGCWKGCW
jgi:hypothetical protein